jgi:hypothetical protein
MPSPKQYAEGLSAMTDKKEALFQSGIRATPWFTEFVDTHGEEPNLSPSADYNYRKAWDAGLSPTPNEYDNNRHHWPSSLPNGEMLKKQGHPTLWKEHYMRATGTDPDSVGATEQDYLKLYAKP